MDRDFLSEDGKLVLLSVTGGGRPAKLGAELVAMDTAGMFQAFVHSDGDLGPQGIVAGIYTGGTNHGGEFRINQHLTADHYKHSLLARIARPASRDQE